MGIRLRPLLALPLVAALLGPGHSCASQEALTTKAAHLRAGPGRSYPVVAILPPGLPVRVEGCLADYSWCDVSEDGERGWMYAGNLALPYEGREVPVLRYGPVIGIGIVGFVLFDYWDTHYRNRPWYHDRDRWAHRPHPQPRPPVAHPPPPPHEGHRPPPAAQPQPHDPVRRIPEPPPRQDRQDPRNRQ